MRRGPSRLMIVLTALKRKEVRHDPHASPTLATAMPLMPVNGEQMSQALDGGAGFAGAPEPQQPAEQRSRRAIMTGIMAEGVASRWDDSSRGANLTGVAGNGSPRYGCVAQDRVVQSPRSTFAASARRTGWSLT